MTSWYDQILDRSSKIVVGFNLVAVPCLLVTIIEEEFKS